MTSNDWNNAKVPNTPSIGTPKHWDAINILDWCYIVKLQSFVWMPDPMKHEYNKNQFNDLFSHIEMPTKRVGNRNIPLTPEQYIKEENNTDRVFAKIDMLTDVKGHVGYDEAGLKVLNLFKHPPLPPESFDADVEPMLEFLDYLFDGNREAIDHLNFWIAHFIFKPEIRLNHGILVSGNQGTGKTTLGEIVKALGGSSGRTITPQEMDGNFQDWAKNSRLVLVEEVKQTGKFDFYNKLKPYITNETIRINPKFVPAYDLNNILCFMMFSNYQNPIAIDKDDRRFFYYHSKAERKDKDYYTNLYDYLFEQGGIWAYREFLEKNYFLRLTVDFAFDPPPQTEAHRMAGEASVTSLEEYIADQLAEGSGYYAPNKIFNLVDFKETLKDKDFSVLKNASETNAILQDLGLNHKRITATHIFKGKRQVGWWSHSDAYIREILDDTSAIGREALAHAFTTGYDNTKSADPELSAYLEALKARTDAKLKAK